MRRTAADALRLLGTGAAGDEQRDNFSFGRLRTVVTTILICRTGACECSLSRIITDMDDDRFLSALGLVARSDCCGGAGGEMVVLRGADAQFYNATPTHVISVSLCHLELFSFRTYHTPRRNTWSVRHYIFRAPDRRSVSVSALSPTSPASPGPEFMNQKLVMNFLVALQNRTST